jgi:hypothetical protein
MGGRRNFVFFFWDKFSSVGKINFVNQTDFTNHLPIDFVDNFQFFHIPTLPTNFQCQERNLAE